MVKIYITWEITDKEYISVGVNKTYEGALKLKNSLKDKEDTKYVIYDYDMGE